MQGLLLLLAISISTHLLPNLSNAVERKATELLSYMWISYARLRERKSCCAGELNTLIPISDTQ